MLSFFIIASYVILSFIFNVLLFTAFYNEKWKCITTLKGDGTTEEDSVTNIANGEPEVSNKIQIPHSTGHGAPMYYKLGQVGHMKYEPAH